MVSTITAAVQARRYKFGHD